MNQDVKKLQDQVNKLQIIVKELSDWKKARMKQQLFAPFDAISKTVISAPIDAGAINGKDTTQNITISSTPQTITVPVAPTGYRALNIGGTNFNIPFYV